MREKIDAGEVGLLPAQAQGPRPATARRSARLTATGKSRCSSSQRNGNADVPAGPCTARARVAFRSRPINVMTTVFLW